MRKINIGKKIYDVISQEEFIRRSNANPEAMNNLADDTAVECHGQVYPITTTYSKDNMAVMKCGPSCLLYSNPDNFPNKEQYDSKNIIDFENVQGGLAEKIKVAAKLEAAERSVLISKDNIYQVAIKEDDTPEMKLFKTALNKKSVDILSYKPRFSSDYSNDVRVIQGNSITFGKLKKLADIFDMDVEMTIKDKKGAANPIGETLHTKING